MSEIDKKGPLCLLLIASCRRGWGPTPAGLTAQPLGGRAALRLALEGLWLVKIPKELKITGGRVVRSPTDLLSLPQT